MDTTVSGPVGPEVGHTALIGPLTARTMLPTEVAEGRLSIVEHYLAPKELGAPLHRHAREDEYTVVVQGRVGVLLGEDVYEAGPGETRPRSRTPSCARSWARCGRPGTGLSGTWRSW